jgi:hypothetical protein
MPEEEKTTHHLWDKLFKVVGDYFPTDILEFVYPGGNLQYYGKFEQERITISYQTADINLWVMDKGVKKLLNIEPYSEWKDSLPAVVFTRNGIITKSLDYKYQVISIAVLLDKEPQRGFTRLPLPEKWSTNTIFW